MLALGRGVCVCLRVEVGATGRELLLGEELDVYVRGGQGTFSLRVVGVLCDRMMNMPCLCTFFIRLSF